MRALTQNLANRQLRDRLVNVTRRIVRVDADSEDAAHDAIVHALRHAGQFRAEAQVSTWLHRIAVNTALMARRSSSRRRRHLDTMANEVAHAEGLPSVARTEADPEEQLAELARRRQVRMLVGLLPAPYREVIERCIYGEEAPEETARALGLTVAAVRTRLARARTQLELLLRGDAPAREAA